MCKIYFNKFSLVIADLFPITLTDNAAAKELINKAKFKSIFLKMHIERIDNTVSPAPILSIALSSKAGDV